MIRYRRLHGPVRHLVRGTALVFGIILTGRGPGAAELPRCAPEASCEATPGMTLWQAVQAPRNFYTVAYGGGRFVAMTEVGEGEVFTSTDGASWTKADYSFGRYPGWLGYRSGAFVCIASKDNQTPITKKPSELIVASSTDGRSWKTSSVVANGNRFWQVRHAHGAFLHVGRYGTILYSADGAAWTIERRVTHADLNAVAFGAGLFVAVGQAGTILTSPDGLRWTKRCSGVTENLADVVYAGGRFVTVARAYTAFAPVEGVVLSSTDGINWARDFSAKGNGLRALAYGAGQYVAVGGIGAPTDRGTILTSTSERLGANGSPSDQENSPIVGFLAKPDYSQLNVVKQGPSGEITISNPIVAADDDVYSYPQLKQRGANAADLLPPNWTVEMSASGDLNSDDLDDIAFVAREDGSGIVMANPTVDEEGLRVVHPRMLVVAFREAGGQQLHVVARDTRMLPPQTTAYDLNWSLRVANGVFETRFAGTFPFSSWDDPEIVEVNATYKFRYQDGAVRLIGAEVTAASDKDKWHERMSVNMLAGKKVTTRREGRREIERFEKPAELPALGVLNWSRKNKVPEPEVDPFLPPFIRSDW